MKDIPTRLKLTEDAGEMAASVRPVSRRDLWFAAAGIALGFAIMFVAGRVILPYRLSIPAQAAAALLVAVMIQHLIYYAVSFLEVRASRDGLQLRYRYALVRKHLPPRALGPIRLTDEEGSPLAGINMGPLSGSLWCESEGSYQSFGRGLSEEDARMLAERINAALGKG